MARIITDAQTQKSRKTWNQLEAANRFTFTVVDTFNARRHFQKYLTKRETNQAS